AGAPAATSLPSQLVDESKTSMSIAVACAARLCMSSVSAGQSPPPPQPATAAESSKTSEWVGRTRTDLSVASVRQTHRIYCRGHHARRAVCVPRLLRGLGRDAHAGEHGAQKDDAGHDADEVQERAGHRAGAGDVGAGLLLNLGGP